MARMKREEENEGPMRGADTSDSFLELAAPPPAPASAPPDTFLELASPGPASPAPAAAAAPPPTAPPPPPVPQPGQKCPCRTTSRGHPPLQEPARPPTSNPNPEPQPQPQPQPENRTRTRTRTRTLTAWACPLGLRGEPSGPRGCRPEAGVALWCTGQEL